MERDRSFNLESCSVKSAGSTSIQKRGANFRMTEGFKYFVKGRFSSPSQVKNLE